MKVKLLKDKNLHPYKYKNGEIADIPERIAMRWIDRKIAQQIKNTQELIVYDNIINPKMCIIPETDYINHESVSIVIPVFNALDYVKKCLESLVKYTSNYELIIIDNGSDKKTKEYLAERKEQLGFILQTNKKNMGFSYSCNQGIKLSSCNYICFLNSDTMLTPNWLGKLMKGFNMPNAGIVGPSTCFSGGEQCIWKLAKNRAGMDQDFINTINPGTGIVETEIYGFCYMVSRRVINDIGVFDVDRYPIGSAEEKDFSWRAHKAGYRSYHVKDSYVHHFGNKTFIEMGIKPGVIRKENDKAFEARKSDKNIYIKNKVVISKPVIPILMIVLDRLEYTRKAVSSVLNNTNYPFKLFIFNNGSNAKTTKYLDGIKDSRIEQYHSTQNLGLVPAMNMFFDKFKDFRYVAKVDNDTVVYPDWLGKLKDVMDAFPLFTVQANHYLAMPFRIDNNEEFYEQCFGVEFNGSMLYFFKNSGGTGQLIRRDLIDKPLAKLSNTKGKGGLSGWCNMQVQKYRQYPSAFYTGVWIDRLDQIATNKYKEVSDYPAYDEMIAKMRPWGLGYVKMNTVELDKVKKEMKAWYKENVGSLH